MRIETTHVAIAGGRIFCNISFLLFQFHSTIEASYPVYNQDVTATLGVAMTAKVPPKPTTCQEKGCTMAGLFASVWRGKCLFELHQRSFPIT